VPVFRAIYSLLLGLVSLALLVSVSPDFKEINLRVVVFLFKNYISSLTNFSITLE